MEFFNDIFPELTEKDYYETIELLLMFSCLISYIIEKDRQEGNYRKVASEYRFALGMAIDAVTEIRKQVFEKHQEDRG